MPFTLSHTAAALPFSRLKPFWPGLIIGTMAPDFEYFLRLSDDDHLGHRLPGLLILTLPLALSVLWIFESYIREPAFELLPSGVQRRLKTEKQGLPFTGWKSFGSTILWIGIGIATHLVWDWFTHPQTWILAHWSWPRQKDAVPFHPPVMMVQLLHYGSSLFGLVVTMAWFEFWYYSSVPTEEVTTRPLSAMHKVLVVGIMAAVVLATCSPFALMRLRHLNWVASSEVPVTTSVEAMILLLSLQILVYGIVRTQVLRSKRKAAQLSR